MHLVHLNTISRRAPRPVIALAIAVVLSVASLAPVAAQDSKIQDAFNRFDKLYASHDYVAALETAKKLEATLKGRVGTKHPTYAAALMQQAQALAALAKYADAETLYTRALAIIDNKADAADLALLGLNGLGGVYSARGKYAA